MEEARLISYKAPIDEDPDDESIFGDLLDEKVVTYEMEFENIELIDGLSS